MTSAHSKPQATGMPEEPGHSCSSSQQAVWTSASRHGSVDDAQLAPHEPGKSAELHDVAKSA